MREYSEIELILLQDPHVVNIEPEEEWEFHDVDCSIFKDLRFVHEYIRSLQGFLKCPYIADDFTKHPMRELWRLEEVPQKYDKRVSDYLKRNALRSLNNIVAHHCTDVINEDNYCGTNAEQFKKELDELREAYSRIIEIHTGVTPIELVKELKRRVYSLLEFLSRQSPAT